MGILPACMSEYYLCAMPRKVRREHQMPWTRVKDDLSCRVTAGNWTWSSRWTDSVFKAESSLQVFYQQTQITIDKNGAGHGDSIQKAEAGEPYFRNSRSWMYSCFVLLRITATASLLRSKWLTIEQHPWSWQQRWEKRTMHLVGKGWGTWRV